MVQRWIRLIYRIVQIRILYIKYLLSVRSLQVQAFEIQRLKVQDEWRTVFTWQTKGCYQIKVEDVDGAVLPGTVSGVFIQSADQDKYVTVTFCGVFDKEVRRIFVEGTPDQLFDFSTDVPSFTCSPPGFELISEVNSGLVTAINIQSVPIRVQVEIQPSGIDYLHIFQKQNKYA